MAIVLETFKKECNQLLRDKKYKELMDKCGSDWERNQEHLTGEEKCYLHYYRAYAWSGLIQAVYEPGYFQGKAYTNYCGVLAEMLLQIGATLYLRTKYKVLDVGHIENDLLNLPAATLSDALLSLSPQFCAETKKDIETIEKSKKQGELDAEGTKIALRMINEYQYTVAVIEMALSLSRSQKDAASLRPCLYDVCYNLANTIYQDLRPSEKMLRKAFLYAKKAADCASHSEKDAAKLLTQNIRDSLASLRAINSRGGRRVGKIKESVVRTEKTQSKKRGRVPVTQGDFFDKRPTISPVDQYGLPFKKRKML